MSKGVMILAIFLVGGTLLAGAATWSNLGVDRAETPQGVSLKDESVRSGGRGFFYGYYGRSHSGGGLRGGK